MSTSAFFRIGLKIAAAASLLALVAACSSSRHEASPDKIETPKIHAPKVQDELKDLPKGLRPDTKNAAHTTEQFKVE